MDYEWDEGKRIANLRKHGLDFRETPTFFEGWTFVLDAVPEIGESRFIALGTIHEIVAVVVYTYRENRTRIISMRKATGHERRQYFKALADRLGPPPADDR